ncbi:hypothetical protein O3M35_005962 [Rhynocoris fuscipes]|uniref:Uncharacterized protein n=1 Tax=Rhynocoris fuscipes TaxID=488301 RepID=A0AAW1DBH9_9HEMI
MPGLHHGNLCWGNRKSFYIYGEFPTEISSMDIRRYDPVASTTPVYISSSGYYGYQRITNPHKEDETMDTAEDINEEAAVTVPLACRKRQSNELNLEHVKRTRYHEASEPSENFHHRDGRTSLMSTYNLGFYML